MYSSVIKKKAVRRYFCLQKRIIWDRGPKSSSFDKSPDPKKKTHIHVHVKHYHHLASRNHDTCFHFLHYYAVFRAVFSTEFLHNFILIQIFTFWMHRISAVFVFIFLFLGSIIVYIGAVNQSFTNDRFECKYLNDWSGFCQVYFSIIYNGVSRKYM